MNRIRGMARIASEAMDVHGGSAAMGFSAKRARNWFRAGYVAASALILMTIGIVVLAGRPPTKVQAEAIKPMTGIPTSLADQLPQLQGWKVADGADLDTDAGSWLQQQGERNNRTSDGDLNSDQSLDDAYVFKRPPGPPGTNSARFSLFIAGKERYDAEMPGIAAMAQISKNALGNVEWRGRRPPDAPNAGGIIVVQRFRDPGSAIVFYMSGTRLITGVPKDFRALSLQ